MIALITQLGFGIVMPILPAYATSFNVTLAAVGWVITAYGLSRLLVNYPVGLLSERWGRRPLLFVGGIVLGVGSILCGFADNFMQLIAYRFIAGAGAATVVTAAHIMLADISTRENRGRMMSLYQGFFLLGISLGPLPGGLIAEKFGLGAPFVGFGLLAITAAIIAGILVPETRHLSHLTRSVATSVPTKTITHMTNVQTPTLAPSQQSFSVRSLLFNRGFLLVSLINFSQFFTRTGAQFNIIPMMGTIRLQLTTTDIGMALTVMAVCTVLMLYPAGYLADRYGRKLPLVSSTILSGLGMLIFGFADSYLIYMIAAVTWGLGAGVSGTLPSTYAADLVPASAFGATMGIFRTLADAGYVFGPVLLGAIADEWGFAWSLWLCSILFLFGGTAFGFGAPETHVVKLAKR